MGEISCASEIYHDIRLWTFIIQATKFDREPTEYKKGISNFAIEYS